MTTIERVYRYPLALLERQVIDMPPGSQVLSVQLRDSDRGRAPNDPALRLQLWARVPLDQEFDIPNNSFPIYIKGTGYDLDIDPNCRFVGTVQLANGDLIFHVFVGPSFPSK